MFKRENIYQKNNNKVQGMSSRQQVLFLLQKTQKQANWDMNDDSDFNNEYSDEDRQYEDYSPRRGLCSFENEQNLQSNGSYNEDFEIKREQLRKFEMENQSLRFRLLAYSLTQFQPIKKNKYLERKRTILTEQEAQMLICTCKKQVIHKSQQNLNVAPQKLTYESYNCGENCINRCVSTECSPISCPCGPYFCKNRRFQLHQNAHIFPAKTQKKGWGLFAGEQILKGQFVMQYLGEVFSTESDIGIERLKKYKNSTCTYLMKTNNNEVIDPTYSGNIARFMNHSCEPNCETQKWNVVGEVSVGIFALRDIQENEELTFDYQFDFFKTPFTKCYCGAKKCKGYLGILATTEVKDDSKSRITAPICSFCNRNVTNQDDLVICNGQCRQIFHLLCVFQSDQNIQKVQLSFFNLAQNKRSYICYTCQQPEQLNIKKKRGRKPLKQQNEQLNSIIINTTSENPQEDGTEDLAPWESISEDLQQYYSNNDHNLLMDKMIARELECIEKSRDKKMSLIKKKNSSFLNQYSEFYNFMFQFTKRLKIRMNESKKYKFRKNQDQKKEELEKKNQLKLEKQRKKSEKLNKMLSLGKSQSYQDKSKKDLQEEYKNENDKQIMSEEDELDDEEEEEEEDEEEEELEEVEELSEFDESDSDEENYEEEESSSELERKQFEYNLQQLEKLEEGEEEDKESSEIKEVDQQNNKLLNFSSLMANPNFQQQDQPLRKLSLKQSPRKNSILPGSEMNKDKQQIQTLIKERIYAFINEENAYYQQLKQQTSTELMQEEIRDSKINLYEPVFTLVILQNLDHFQDDINLQLYWDNPWGGMVCLRLNSTKRQYQFLTSLLQEVTDYLFEKGLIHGNTLGFGGQFLMEKSHYYSLRYGGTDQRIMQGFMVLSQENELFLQKSLYPFEICGVQVPKNYLRKLVGYQERELQQMRRFFFVDFDFNRDLMVDDVFLIDELTQIRIFGRGRDVLKVRMIQAKTLLFQMVDCKLIMDSIKEIKLLVDPCEIRVKKMYREWKDLRHPFYYLPNYLREVLLIGTQEEITKGEQQIEQFLMRNRTNEYQINGSSQQLSYLLPMSFQPQMFSIKQMILQRFPQLQFFSYEPTFPRKHLTVIIIGPWNLICEGKRLLESMVNKMENLIQVSFENFQQFTHHQQIRFSFKSLKRFILEHDIKYLNHWDTCSLFVEEAGKMIKYNDSNQYSNEQSEYEQEFIVDKQRASYQNYYDPSHTNQSSSQNYHYGSSSHRQYQGYNHYPNRSQYREENKDYGSYYSVNSDQRQSNKYNAFFAEQKEEYNSLISFLKQDSETLVNCLFVLSQTNEASLQSLMKRLQVNKREFIQKLIDIIDQNLYELHRFQKGGYVQKKFGNYNNYNNYNNKYDQPNSFYKSQPISSTQSHNIQPFKEFTDYSQKVENKEHSYTDYKPNQFREYNAPIVQHPKQQQFDQHRGQDEYRKDNYYNRQVNYQQQYPPNTQQYKIFRSKSPSQQSYRGPIIQREVNEFHMSSNQNIKKQRRNSFSQYSSSSRNSSFDDRHQEPIYKKHYSDHNDRYYQFKQYNNDHHHQDNYRSYQPDNQFSKRHHHHHHEHRPHHSRHRHRHRDHNLHKEQDFNQGRHIQQQPSHHRSRNRSQSHNRNNY